MLRRQWMLLMGIAVLNTFVVMPALAADHTHEGTVVSAGAGKLTMTAKGDTKQHVHDVAKDAVITVDGKPAKLEDVKAGSHVIVVQGEKHVVTKITAHSKQG